MLLLIHTYACYVNTNQIVEPEKEKQKKKENVNVDWACGVVDLLYIYLAVCGCISLEITENKYEENLHVGKSHDSFCAHVLW